MFGFHRELGIVSMQRRSAQKSFRLFRSGDGGAPRRSRSIASPVVKLFYSMHGDGETQANNMMGTLQETWILVTGDTETMEMIKSDYWQFKIRQSCLNHTIHVTSLNSTHAAECKQTKISICFCQSVSHSLIHDCFKAGLHKLLQLEPKEKFGVLVFKILVMKSNFVTCWPKVWQTMELKCLWSVLIS